MAKYEVTSGDMNETIEADGQQSAAIAALQKRNWTSLGLLIVIKKVGGTPDDDCFWDSVTALERAGFTQHRS